MPRSTVKVEVRMGALREIRRHAPEVLRALDLPLRDGVNRWLDQSLFIVPRGGAPGDPTNLADTAFKSGPLYNLESPLSSTWTAGYAHPAAGAIHEGWHWGIEGFVPPPRFLARAKRGVRPLVRKGVGKTLMEWLARNAQKR